MWRKKLNLNDDDLLFLQIVIMCDPKAGSVIEGTGGLRKLRFSPPSFPKGQSKALRVIYKYFERSHMVALGVVYPKGMKDDLSAEEKKRIRIAVEAIEQEFGC